MVVNLLFFEIKKLCVCVSMYLFVCLFVCLCVHVRVIHTRSVLVLAKAKSVEALKKMGSRCVLLVTPSHQLQVFVVAGCSFVL